MRLLLLKSAIPAGARWITIRSHGPDAKGQPVLIEPQPDGSAKVIGGAGGKLNHLRIRGVRSEADYKAEADKQRAAKTEEKKAQRAADKAAGILESKTKAKQAVRDQHQGHEREFIQAVGQAMGWDTEALAFKPENYPGVSEQALKKLADRHHRQLLEKAKAAVEAQRQKLVADADARAEAGLGEVPLTAPADQLSVQDLSPIPDNTSGLGYAPDYKGRAEAAGATKEATRAEADEARALTPEQRAKRIARGETAKMIQGELKGIREPAAPKLATDLANIKKSVDMLKAEKKLKELSRQAREAGRKIDESVKSVEPQAFVLQYDADPDLDEKIKQDVGDALRTAKTVAFLSEFKRIAGDKPEETLGRHVGVGAYNSINALALAVGGDALVDRDVVDVLGIAGAAQVLARRIHNDLPDDVEDIAQGVQDFHLHRYMEASSDAMARANELMDAAKEIELGEANTAHELAAAQELNGQRRAAIGDAQKVLGQAYGEMEATAALSVALRRKPPAELQVPMPGLSLEQAITRARAIGLQRGDYSVDTAGGTTFLNVHGAGLDRLARPVSKDDVKQVQRNLSIMRGDEDEADWLPHGVSDRPDLAMDVKPGVAERLARPFEPSGDLEQSLRDYIGGRAADGDTPADIVADIQSADYFRKAGHGYQEALDAVAPLKGEDGKQQRVEALGEQFDRYADEFVTREYGGARSPLNRQKLELDDTTADALHRALAEHPDGVSAYKQIGELTSQDQRTLRETFYRDVARESPEAAGMRAELEQLEAAEPERDTEDMFGETTRNPEHEEWQQRRDDLAGKLGSASLDWAKYAQTMRGHERAYEAIQDLIKGRVANSFAEAHNRLRPGAPIKTGRAVIRQNLNHLDATDPAARDQRLARERELVDGLRERVQGRYSSGGVADKLDAARDQREAFEQAQMGFFSSEESPQTSDNPMAGDERHTLGHVAERQLAGLMGKVGQNFKPGRPVQIGRPSMSGGDNFARQRAIKLIDANKRLGLHLGAGSGKTLVSMGAFTHLHGQGKAKRGIFAVPSVVQGQFAGDALKFLEPGKYKWHAQPGASRDERIAAYKDGSNHFVVTTHQALRDDMLHLGAKHAGIAEGEMRDRLKAMTRSERQSWASSVLEKEGINFDFSAVDEGHNLLDREGKEDSGMSHVLGGLTDHTPNHISMTADPVRNDDASEVFSALQKIAPNRYTDRDAFMRRYGVDTVAARDGLKREMARYFYAHSIKPDVRSTRSEVKVPLSDGQKQAMAALDKDVAAMRLARMGGRVDVEAARRVSPESFKGVPEAEHEKTAKGLQDAIGVVKDAAVRKVIDEHPDAEKAAEVLRQVKSRPGQPGVVFARSRAAVESLRKKLEGEGLRVVTITGSDSSAEKDRKREMFSPAAGAAKADILVASDAASTGLNAQRGKWLIQYDTPATAMTHAQRQARIERIGQKNDIELVDLVGDHASERNARSRLARKYALRDVMSSPLEKLDDTGLGYFLKQRQASKLNAS